MKSSPEIRCGGSFYNKTVRDKLGKWNVIRIDSFFLYNKMGAFGKFLKRRKGIEEAVSGVQGYHEGGEEPEVSLDMRNMQNL